MAVITSSTPNPIGCFMAQGPPADMLWLTKLTVPLSWTKWAPALWYFPHPTCTAQSTKWLHSLWGHCTQRAASPSIPRNIPSNILDHSCSCQWRRPTQENCHHQATHKYKSGTDLEGEISLQQENVGHHPVCFCSGLSLWASPPWSVPLIPLHMETIAVNSLVSTFFKVSFDSCLII